MADLEQIAKFNGEGFHAWQEKTMYHLMRKDLWDLFEDEEEDANAEEGLVEEILPKTPE